MSEAAKQRRCKLLCRQGKHKMHKLLSTPAWRKFVTKLSPFCCSEAHLVYKLPFCQAKLRNGSSGLKAQDGKCLAMLEAKKASHAALILQLVASMPFLQVASSKLLKLHVSVLSTSCLCKLLLLLLVKLTD